MAGGKPRENTKGAGLVVRGQRQEASRENAPSGSCSHCFQRRATSSLTPTSYPKSSHAFKRHRIRRDHNNLRGNCIGSSSGIPSNTLPVEPTELLKQAPNVQQSIVLLRSISCRLLLFCAQDCSSLASGAQWWKIVMAGLERVSRITTSGRLALHSFLEKSIKNIPL